MDSDVDGGSVRLFAGDLVHVDDVLLAIDAHYATGIALEMSARDTDLILDSEMGRVAVLGIGYGI